MQETYKGILVESESEKLVLDWLFELQEKGFIYSIGRSPELIISRGLENKYLKKTILKTKTKEELKFQQLLNPHHYTPEFTVKWFNHTPQSIIWSMSNVGLCKCESPLIGHSFSFNIPAPNGDLTHNGFVTYIEVKPSFDYQNMSRLFLLNQKWVWESRKMFINLLQPEKLYKATFTPAVYHFTRVKKTEREIKWKTRTIDEYLKSIGYEAPIS